VPTRHGDVVEEDVAIRMTARRSGLLVKEKAGAGIGTTLDYQQGLSLGQALDTGQRSFLALAVRLVEQLGAKHRGGFGRRLGEVLVFTHYRLLPNSKGRAVWPLRFSTIPCHSIRKKHP